MFSDILTALPAGPSGRLVHVQTEAMEGPRRFLIPGQEKASAGEAEARIRSALRLSGISAPPEGARVLLAPLPLLPCPVPDLAVAAGLLVSMGVLPQEAFRGCLLAGSLLPDGTIRPAEGIPALVREAKDRGLRACLLPLSCLPRDGKACRPVCLGFESLKDLMAYAVSVSARDPEGGFL